MFTWIGIGALYLLGIGFFRWLGGIGAAADVIARWGRAAATGTRRRTGSSEGCSPFRPCPRS
jgi:hypothetical protein